MDIWTMIADQRRQLVDVFDSLDEGQWNTPSLCPEWTVRDVAGHLITPFALGMAKILLRFAGNGFNFNKTMLKTAKQLAQRPTSELVHILRANIETRWKPPGLGPEAPLTDTVMHTQDICRPLGIEQRVDREKARPVLDFLVGKGRAVTNPAWIVGLRLAPDDVDWSWGEGPAVQGSAGAIIMAIGGRPVALADLTGDGVKQLQARLAQG